MSDLTREALRAIQERIRKAAGEFSEGKISAAWFQMEVDLLGRAYEVLNEVAAEPNG